jgi:hypothetical protein
VVSRCRSLRAYLVIWGLAFVASKLGLDGYSAAELQRSRPEEVASPHIGGAFRSAHWRLIKNPNLRSRRS